MVACFAGSVSGLGFCLSCLDPFIETRHGAEQFVLFVFRVAIPVALLDVAADSFENVVVVEIAKFNAVRLVLHCYFAAVDVDRAALRVETFCSELVHCVVCVVCWARVFVSLA